MRSECDPAFCTRRLFRLTRLSLTIVTAVAPRGCGQVAPQGAPDEDRRADGTLARPSATVVNGALLGADVSSGRWRCPPSRCWSEKRCKEFLTRIVGGGETTSHGRVTFCGRTTCDTSSVGHGAYARMQVHSAAREITVAGGEPADIARPSSAGQRTSEMKFGILIDPSEMAAATRAV